MVVCCLFLVLATATASELISYAEFFGISKLGMYITTIFCLCLPNRIKIR